MRNGALFVLVAGSAVANGLFLDRIPLWRQVLIVLLATAAYLHGRHLPVRRDGALLAAVAAATAGCAVVDLPAAVGALLVLGVFVTLPWLAGRFRRQQAALVRAGAEQVRHLEREQQFVADHARLLERARIAADMHDALGHDLALIALRAGALELAPEMTGANREAAAELRVSAVAAADRLRHTVTGLRTAPDPAYEISLDALVDRARDAGMPVRLHRAAGVGLTDRAVHRVVQEALTNAARHAPGAEVDIRLDRTGDSVTVTVCNPIEGPPASSGAGSGIAGLRDYLGRVGGTLRVDATPGTFTLTARLPAAGTTGAGR